MRQSALNSYRLLVCLAIVAGGGILPAAFSAGESEPSDAGAPTFKLQGHAMVEEQQISRNKNLEAWQASQAYRWGAMSLDVGNLPYACEWFRVAGDGFEASIGESKFLAEARFAEGFARLRMGQQAKAAQLFDIAVKLFRKYDPYSPYLRAGVAALDRLPKPKMRPLQAKIEERQEKKFKMVALPGQLDKVSRTVPLAGKLTALEDGTLLASLRDDQVFVGGKKRLLSQAAALDISDEYVKKTVYKAFLKMTCLEFSALTANYETAGKNYKALKASGKTVAVGAADDWATPSVSLVLNGNSYKVPMDLPGINRTSKNVLLVTDGQTVLAIDPRTDDTWKLIATFYQQHADFNWWKLTHRKGSS